jgi:FliI/YscN family ATPase
MLLLDSATRLAHAQREVGLSIGEPPTTKGYPPSVYTMFPRLLERAGKAETGSITAIYTVLVEADDLSEPVSDTLRSILDGHIVLSRRLASMKHYPAVDVLESISRLMIDIASKEHLNAASQMFKLLAAYREAEDLINIGAYAPGSNPLIDMAIKMHPKIMGFLQQRIEEKYEFKATINALCSIMEEAV